MDNYTFSTYLQGVMPEFNVPEKKEVKTSSTTNPSVFNQKSSDALVDNFSKSNSSEKLDKFFNGANYSKEDYEKTFSTKISEKEYSDLKAKYHNPLKAKDYVFDNVNQGGIDSCYMLSSLSSRKDDIEKSKCMKWNDDGSCDVSLYKVQKGNPDLSMFGAYMNLIKGNYTKKLYQASDEKKTLHITPDELAKTDFAVTKNGKPTTIKLSSTQDITAKAMEIALIKYHDNEVNFDNLGGTLEKMQKMLYGKNAPEVKETWPGRIKASQISKAATCSLPVKGGLLSGSAAKDYVNARNADGDVTINDANNKPVTIMDKHAYTINGYDKKTNTVSISNPHKNDLNSKKDDIVIPFETFKNIFGIEYID